MAGLVYEEASNKLRLTGGSEGEEEGLEVELEAGLLPSAWRSLDRVSCNSSYDRWGTGHWAWGGADFDAKMIPRSRKQYHHD